MSEKDTIYVVTIGIAKCEEPFHHKVDASYRSLEQATFHAGNLREELGKMHQEEIDWERTVISKDQIEWSNHAAPTAEDQYYELRVTKSVLYNH